MNASSTARFGREPKECAFGAGFRPLNLGIEWNAENQLIEVSENETTIATIEYDPLGRRVEKVAGGTTSTFTYEGEDILREIAGATTTYYVHGPGIDEPLTNEISGSPTYYHADALGSVLKMTNASGSVTHEYRYDVYGRIEAGSTQGGYSLTGREWDPESSLFYYRARYFNPTLGRLLSEDPIGLTAGINQYTYAANNPGNLVDPEGTHPAIAAIILLAIAFVLNNPTIVNEEEGPTATTILPNAVVTAKYLAPPLSPGVSVRPKHSGENLSRRPSLSHQQTPRNTHRKKSRPVGKFGEAADRAVSNGYWKLEKPMKDGSWQPINPSTMKPGTRPETHIKFPPKGG